MASFLAPKKPAEAEVLPSPWRGWSGWWYVGRLQKGHIDRLGILFSICDQAHEGPVFFDVNFCWEIVGFVLKEFGGSDFVGGFRISGSIRDVGKRKRCHNACVSISSPSFFDSGLSLVGINIYMNIWDKVFVMLLLIKNNLNKSVNY